MAKREETQNLAQGITTEAPKLLQQAHREAAGYDARAGSAISSLFIERLANFLQPVVDFIGTILGALNVNLSSDWTTFYNILGALYLDERNTGGRAYGYVTIGVEEPALLEIPSGTVFYTNSGLQYRTTRRHTFSAAHYTLEEEIYYTPNIYVEAAEPGEDYRVDAGQITNTFFTEVNIAEVYNAAPMQGGAEEESTEAFLQRLRDSVSTRTLSSVPGIQYLLSRHFEDVVYRAEIVASGDSEMERDTLYDYSGEDASFIGRIDFARKVAGSIAEEPSVAYVDLQEDEEPAVTVDGDGVASVVGFNVEFTQDRYAQVNTQDNNLLTYESSPVLTEDWNRGGETPDLTPWKVSETQATTWSRHAEYAVIESNRLVLGAQAMAQNIQGGQQFLQEVARQAAGLVKDTLRQPEYGTLASRLNRTVADDEIIGLGSMDEVIDSSFTQAVAGENINFQQIRSNLSPVVQLTLTQAKGIVVRGDFEIEDDDLSAERPLYITNFRYKEANPRAYDGYGIAVFPTGVKDSNNIFVTDNSIMNDDLFIAGEDTYDALVTDNYIAGTTLQIDVGTQYNYELIYGDPPAGASDNAVTLEIRIWEQGTARPGTPTLQMGAYVPMNLRSQSLTGAGQTPTDATAFGFGVLQTGGFTWSFGAVEITPSSPSYTHLLYVLDAERFGAETVEMLAGHRGQGATGGVVARESNVRIVDFDDINNPVWELVDTNSTGILEVSRTLIGLDRYTDNDYNLFLLVSSGYPADAVNDVVANVEMDYVALLRQQSSVHTGGKADVYIHPKAEDSVPEITATNDLVSVGGYLLLTEENGFNRPVTRVDEVEILDGNGDPTGTYLEEYTDYRVISNVPAEDGSSQENKMIIFSDYAQLYSIRVRYRYVQEIASIQAYFDGADARPSRLDLLAKMPHPKYVTITFTADYNGADLLEAIKSYIYTAEESVRGFDIIALAKEYGAAAASVANFSMSVEWYDADGNRQTASSQDELTKTRTEIFVPETITITTS